MGLSRRTWNVAGQFSRIVSGKGDTTGSISRPGMPHVFRNFKFLIFIGVFLNKELFEI